MKVSVHGRITQDAEGQDQAPLTIGRAREKRTILLKLSPGYDPASSEPTRPFGEDESPIDGPWAYRGYLLLVDDGSDVSLDEAKLKIKHVVLSRDKGFDKMRRELEALQNVERVDGARRERIPDSVRLFVWQRDQGKCVRCGCNSKLEFDHIVPVIKGGSGTERNVQLLCEQCNRSKGSDI